jgi:EAL domain-containing protein (putative c-di-GMP-specific phosphodiesterase class I)
VLKIDKVFIDDIIDNPKELEFLKNIIDIAKSRDRIPLVEGVTSKEQLEVLKKIGCEIMQGYYFSKPIPAERLKELLASGATLPCDS